MVPSSRRIHARFAPQWPRQLPLRMVDPRQARRELPQWCHSRASVEVANCAELSGLNDPLRLNTRAKQPRALPSARPSKRVWRAITSGACAPVAGLAA